MYNIRPKSTLLQKARFYVAVIFINAASVLLLWYVLEVYPFNSLPPSQPVRTIAMEATSPSLDETSKSLAVISGTPMRLVLPSLDLDLSVEEGRYNEANGKWTLSKTAAHYALPTPPVNDQSGNTLIYGHNFDHIFKRLGQLQPGDEAIVYTVNGHVFTYAYESSYHVPPEDLSVFNPTEQPMLTLQTCTGNWNEVRRMSKFRLKSVDGS